MKRKLIPWIGILVLPVLCTGCQLMPEEETFQEPPVLHSYEIKEYAQETVMRGDLILGMTVNCTYMAAKQEKLGFDLGGGVHRSDLRRSGPAGTKRAAAGGIAV